VFACAWTAESDPIRQLGRCAGADGGSLCRQARGLSIPNSVRKSNPEHFQLKPVPSPSLSNSAVRSASDIGFATWGAFGSLINVERGPPVPARSGRRLSCAQSSQCLGRSDLQPATVSPQRATHGNLEHALGYVRVYVLLPWSRSPEGYPWEEPLRGRTMVLGQ
jgi:hypothetical protein